MGDAPATKQDILLLRQEIALLRQELFRNDMDRMFAAVERRLTIRVGAMFFTGCGLLIAAERLWT